MRASFDFAGRAAFVGLVGMLLVGCADTSARRDGSPNAGLKDESLARVAAATQQTGDYSTAVKLYQKAATDRPKDPDIQVSLGEARQQV